MQTHNIKYIIVSDKPQLFADNPAHLIIAPQDFIHDDLNRISRKARPKVINLSGRYDYLSKGYYISLMAEARRMTCIPNVSNIVTLNWRRHYEFALPELNALLQKTFTEPVAEPLSRTYSCFFGRHENPKIEPVSRRLFDLFRFPVISFTIGADSKDCWHIATIDTPAFSSLSDKQLSRFRQDLDTFTGSAWRSLKKKQAERYWIAILHDPQEAYPPSNKAALKKFISVGRKMGLYIELITKNDFASLLEFDAVFIRTTTAINNHTYRFASKAEQEDIPCIDDTASIIRCCNKVYLKELLDTHKIPTPPTVVLDKKSLTDDSLTRITMPAVLKIPDGSFSRGVNKVSTLADLKDKASKMLQKSDLILCQEFSPSAFDWRVGTIDSKALFASKYYMAKGHWQVYNHNSKTKKDIEGDDEAVPLDLVPPAVLQTALKAASLIGNGFYGVDLKELDDGRVVVIEINDNPSIDCGVEDRIAGDDLYRTILQSLITRIEA